jgi:hypothetical protein
MRSVKAMGLSLLGLCMLATPVAQGYTWDEMTYFTFTRPIEVPGTALPAGTYLFKLAESYSSCDIVQIMSPDETRVYATILAKPDYRIQPTDNTVLTFAERPVNSPDAILTWFYPRMNYGHRFVYPKTSPGNPARLKVRPPLGQE